MFPVAMFSQLTVLYFFDGVVDVIWKGEHMVMEVVMLKMEAEEVTGMEDDRSDKNMGGNDMDNNKTVDTPRCVSGEGKCCSMQKSRPPVRPKMRSSSGGGRTSFPTMLAL